MSLRPPARCLGVFVVASVLGCAVADDLPPPTTAPPATTALLPPLEGPPPDCASHPHLCGLPLVDLGGGDHPRAFHLVFIGDGFTGPGDFVAVVDRLHRGLVDDDGGPVALDPSLFHFWRIDLESAPAPTTDDERRDTPLGAGLLPPDSCVGLPFIAVDGPRLHLALDEAVAVDGDDDDAPGLAALRRRGLVHAIAVVADSTGRANADVDVRISSFDDVTTLRHELGHALFELADEYAEFDACPEGALLASARATDGALVHRPNVQRSTHPAKWQGLSSTSVVGGERVPCLHHASAACLMAGTGERFCPVCALAIDERLDLQRCGDDDREAPRVAIDAPLRSPDLAILPGGSRAVVRAVVDDTRDGGLVPTWLLDGEPIAEGALAELDIVDLEAAARARGHALADAVLVARAVDRHGRVGESRPLLLDEALPGLLEVVVTSSGGLPGLVGVRVESVRPFDLIEVKSALETVVVDSGPGGTATVALRVPPGDGASLRVTARSGDGRLRSAEEEHTFTGPSAAGLPLPEVAFAAGSDAVPLGARSLLFLEVRSCVALLEVGVSVDGGEARRARVAPRRMAGCVDGQQAAVQRYAVDVDGAGDELRPVIIDVTGRLITGPALQVASAEEHVGDCVAVDVGRPKSPFEPVDLVIGAFGDGAALLESGAVLGSETLTLRPRGRERVAALHPTDVTEGERLRVSTTVRCADGLLARLRADVDTAPLLAVVDLRPPLVLAPQHAPRGAGLLDVIVEDDQALASLLVDGAPPTDAPPLPAHRALLRVAPGARVEATDAAGLVTSVVVGDPLPDPRVPACE